MQFLMARSGSAQRMLSYTRACFNPPDLYEGFRNDRRPYPNPFPGGSKNGSNNPDDAHLPPDTYEIQGDPSTPSAHPSAKDLEAAKEVAREHDREGAYKRRVKPKEVASTGSHKVALEEAEGRQEKRSGSGDED